MARWDFSPGEMQAPGVDNLKPNLTPGAQVVQPDGTTWRLEIPAGPARAYRLAQLDDYTRRWRREFPWQAPACLSLQARASAATIPGTWGFGLWNDPFGMAVLSGAEPLRLPALPNAAWFFWASPPNYLSLRDDLPAQGWHAAVFCSPRRQVALLALGALALPLLAFPPAARGLRRLGRRFVRQAGAALPLDPTTWHTYECDWQPDKVVFRADDQVLLQSSVVPQGPLGLVIWIDNQYAALPPDGRLAFGTLLNVEPAWIEIRHLAVARHPQKA